MPPSRADSYEKEAEQAWVSRSRYAAELYDSGAKLWCKEDMIDVERQLEDCHKKKHITVRHMDGSIAKLRNPMYQDRKSNLESFIEFRDYWQLVHRPPKGSPHTFGCPIVVRWCDKSKRSADSQPVANPYQFFNCVRVMWDASGSCQMFKSRLTEILAPAIQNTTPATISKILCFGLGDFSTQSSDQWIREAYPDLGEDEIDSARDLENKGPCLHHAVALTMANVVEAVQAKRCKAQLPPPIKLLTQDPVYTELTKLILQEVGKFEIVGKYGASGFAELDDNCIVFAPFVSAPIRQIVAELARPAIIICTKVDQLIFHNARYAMCRPRVISHRTNVAGLTFSDFLLWGISIH